MSTVDSIKKAGPQATPGLAVIPPSRRIGCSTGGGETASSGWDSFPKDQKGPGLKNLKRSVGLNGPFDILGTAEMGFQTKGHFGQLTGLFIGDSRNLFFGFNQNFQTDPFFRITDNFFCFLLDLFFESGDWIFFVDDKRSGIRLPSTTDLPRPKTALMTDFLILTCPPDRWNTSLPPPRPRSWPYTRHT